MTYDGIVSVLNKQTHETKKFSIRQLIQALPEEVVKTSSSDLFESKDALKRFIMDYAKGLKDMDTKMVLVDYRIYPDGFRGNIPKTDEVNVEKLEELYAEAKAEQDK